MNNKICMEMITYHPINSIEVRETKNINIETIIINTDQKPYLFEDETTREYTVYFEVYIINEKRYMTYQYDCEDLHKALELYEKYLPKVINKTR